MSSESTRSPASVDVYNMCWRTAGAERMGHKSLSSSSKLQVSTQAGVWGGAVWGDAAGKFVGGGVGARGGDFIVLLQRQNVV